MLSRTWVLLSTQEIPQMKVLQVAPSFPKTLMCPFNQLISWIVWKTSKGLQAKEEEQ
jgi:hypothetical protein